MASEFHKKAVSRITVEQRKKTLKEFQKFSRLAAFSLFLTKGLDEAKRVYPEHYDFVEKNQDKTYKEIIAFISE